MTPAALAAIMLVAGACSASSAEAPRESQPRQPRVALAEVGDSVVYLEQTTAITFLARPGDTLAVTSRHDAVIHVVRTAPDTLEGFYEHLVVRFEGGQQTRQLDTDSLLGERFVLHDERGRIETVSAPVLPPNIRQMTDLRRQFDDFFLRLPDRPLEIGGEWVDTVRLSATEGQGSTGRVSVERFRVRADTMVDGLPALVIDYETVIETSMRSAPTTQGTLTSTLTGGEEGTFVYSPAREILLRRHRIGVLEGELVLEGNLETRRFPQSYSYESRIAVLPPVVPSGDATRAPAADAPPIP